MVGRFLYRHSDDSLAPQTAHPRLDARIASLVAARDRLRELHARAASVAEILEVERELARVQGELG